MRSVSRLIYFLVWAFFAQLTGSSLCMAEILLDKDFEPPIEIPSVSGQNEPDLLYRGKASPQYPNEPKQCLLLQKTQKKVEPVYSEQYPWTGYGTIFNCSGMNAQTIMRDSTACRASGGLWAFYEQAATPKCLPINKEHCAAQGGTLQRVGMDAHIGCVVGFNDGGKTCRDSNDCASGVCLVEREGERRITGERIGTCKRDNNLIGCFHYMIKGEVSTKQICVD